MIILEKVLTKKNFIKKNGGRLKKISSLFAFFMKIFNAKNNFCVTKNVLLDFLRYNKYNQKNFKKYAKGGVIIGKRQTET